MPRAGNEMLVAVTWPRTHGHGNLPHQYYRLVKSQGLVFPSSAKQGSEYTKGEISVLQDQKEKLYSTKTNTNFRYRTHHHHPPNPPH